MNNITQSLTINGWLPHHAKYRSQHPAVIFGNSTLSYAELYTEVNNVAHALKQSGIVKGDKIAAWLPNSMELLEIYWACAFLGATVIPVSPLLRSRALTSLLRNSDTKMLITTSHLVSGSLSAEDHKEIVGIDIWLTDSEDNPDYISYHSRKNQYSSALPVSENLTADDPYNIIYSSGTTGAPKGIEINHGVRSLYGSICANSFRITPESVILHAGSIIFNGAFLMLMPAMYLGCTFILHSSFNADHVLETINQKKVTHIILVPSQIINCLPHPNFNSTYLSSLQFLLSLGAPLQHEHKLDLQKKLPFVFYELYGLTEGFMTILDKTNAIRKSGSVGRPPQFMEIKIKNEKGEDLPDGTIGEIVGRGPTLMTGYYNNPELTNKTMRDGWLYTGDLGYLDEDGYLFLSGRKKDIIISGGINIYPIDLESIIILHPNVKDVAVFGIPHKEWGETPVAAIVLNNFLTPKNEELREWANRHIQAKFQKLHDVFILEEFPRNVAGKVLKHDLRNSYLQLQPFPKDQSQKNPE